VLTYLKIGGWQLALLLNFNVAALKEGIERFVLGLKEEGQGTAGTQKSQRNTSFLTDATPCLCSTTDSGDPEAEQLAKDVIAAAMEVHRELGPGLLPSAYEACLCHELHLRGVAFEHSRPLELTYKGAPLAGSDEVKVLVGGRVAVSPHVVDEIRPVHEAELLSQLRLGGWPLGLLINFNTVAFRDGLRRIVQTRKDLSSH
jgi:GxxExxY protein